jgi:hypothetical protein
VGQTLKKSAGPIIVSSENYFFSHFSWLAENPSTLGPMTASERAEK